MPDGAGRGPVAEVVSERAVSLGIAGVDLERSTRWDRGCGGWWCLPCSRQSSARRAAPDPDLLAVAVESCLLAFDLAPQLSDSLVIQDQRGPDAAAFLWVRDDESASCYVAREADGSSSSMGSSMGLTFPAPSTLQVLGIECGPPTMIERTSRPATHRLSSGRSRGARYTRAWRMAASSPGGPAAMRPCRCRKRAPTAATTGSSPPVRPKSSGRRLGGLLLDRLLTSPTEAAVVSEMARCLTELGGRFAGRDGAGPACSLPRGGLAGWTGRRRSVMGVSWHWRVRWSSAAAP